MTPKMTQKNYEAIKIYNQKEKIFELKGQIQTLKRQLKIAVEALENYKGTSYNVAQRALLEIEELEK